MDYKYIEQLLDRYFEAETTLKEEQILKRVARELAPVPPALYCHAAGRDFGR